MVSGTVCHLSLEMIRIHAFTAKQLFWECGRNVELQVDAFDAVSRSRDQGGWAELRSDRFVNIELLRDRELIFASRCCTWSTPSGCL